MAIKDLYHLKKDSFSIDPREDASEFFGGQKLPERIEARLEGDFVRSRQVPKFCVYGPYGGGKTHVQHHIAYLLEHKLGNDYPTIPIFLDISPIRAKERWVKVHADIINAISLGRIKEAVGEVLSDAGASRDPHAHLLAKSVLKYGEVAITSSQAHVFRALLFGGPMEQAALKWLKGGSLSASDCATLGVETNLTEVSHLVACLLNVAGLLKVGLHKRPVLLIDEAESLRSLKQGDSINEFRTAIRRLADDDNNVLGFVFAFGVEGGMEDAPEVLTDPAVESRLDYDSAYFDLQENISRIEDVRKFIEQLLEYLVDQGAAKATIDAASLDTEPEYFPFTESAIDTLSAFIAEDDPRHQLPRQIIKRMSTAVVEAWQRSRAQGGALVLVDDDVIQTALYPAEQG